MTLRSVWESRLQVASSSTRIGASRTTARASASRCPWPAEKFSPPSVGVGHLERSSHDVVGYVLQHGDVVVHAALQEAAVLEHRRDLPPPIRVGDVGMGATVDEHVTAVGVVEAAHEVRDGRLA